LQFVTEKAEHYFIMIVSF